MLFLRPLDTSATVPLDRIQLSYSVPLYSQMKLVFYCCISCRSRVHRDATRRITIAIREKPPFRHPLRHPPPTRRLNKAMLSSSHVSRPSLKCVPRSGFNPTSVRSMRTILILHKALSSLPYSTSTSNPSSPSVSNPNETPLSALPPLPDQSEWRPIFNPPRACVGLRERISIRNPKTARTLAEGFTKWTKPLINANEARRTGGAAKGAPKIIIEAFPGTFHAFVSSIVPLTYSLP